MSKQKKQQSKLVLAKPASSSIVRLDLGAGQNPKEGYEAVDLNAPNPTHRVDLFRFPWQFEDNSVDEIHSSHFIEHIPLRDVEERDLTSAPAHLHRTASEHKALREELLGKDMLFAFFDECYRILKPDGVMTLVWPCSRSDRAFQDPTHRRFIPLQVLHYLDPAWRHANKLDHYRVNCHFAGTSTCSVEQAETVRAPEVAQQRQVNMWNTILDFYATMKAVKPSL